MGKITYTLEDFDKDKAVSGALVIMVSKDYEGTNIANGSYSGSSWQQNNSFGSAGVCSYRGYKFYFTANSHTYIFDYYGWSLFENYMKEKIDAYLAGTSEEASTVGLKDVITAINAIATKIEERGSGISIQDVDTRIKAWLNATTIVADGTGWKLNVPESI